MSWFGFGTDQQVQGTANIQEPPLLSRGEKRDNRGEKREEEKKQLKSLQKYKGSAVLYKHITPDDNGHFYLVSTDDLYDDGREVIIDGTDPTNIKFTNRNPDGTFTDMTYAVKAVDLQNGKLVDIALSDIEGTLANIKKKIKIDSEYGEKFKKVIFPKQKETTNN
jgi:hypothetical protein